MFYNHKELEERYKAIDMCKISADFRLNKMGEYLEEALEKINTKEHGPIRVFKIVFYSTKKRFYESEKELFRWAKYHKKMGYSNLKAYELIDGNWIEVVV